MNYAVVQAYLPYHDFHSLNNNYHLKNNQSEPDFRWCFPEPQQASTEDCGLRVRDYMVNYDFSAPFSNRSGVL
jgi:hypothetical protein